MPEIPRIRSAAGSDRGRQRTSNEDRFVHRPKDRVFAVIDGVGGYAGGDVAAEAAQQALVRRLAHRTGSPEVRLREAVVLANQHIYRQAQQEPALSQMACVLTVALVEHDHVYAAHVGDTRLYKLRAGSIQKLTHDHSLVGVREDAGHLSEREAMEHPRRNEILRDVGSAPHSVEEPEFIEYVEAAFEPDAALLLCTDGLTDLVTEEEVLETVQAHAGRPAQAVKTLIRQANEADGRDNITVVLIEGEAFQQAVLAQSGWADKLATWRSKLPWHDDAP